MPTEKYLIKLCRFKLIFSELSLYSPSSNCEVRALLLGLVIDQSYTGLSIKRHLAESMGGFSEQRLCNIVEGGNKCQLL